MTELTITSTPGMGPLEVSVYPPDGDPVEFTLSAGLTTKSVSVGSGRHTVVARRPNGSRLRRTIIVGTQDASVSLSEAVGTTPNEFMQNEVERGDVAPAPSIPRSIRVGAPLSGMFGDILAKTALGGGIISRALDQRTFEVGAPRTIQETAKSTSLVLRGWRLQDGQWGAVAMADSRIAGIPRSHNFLKLDLRPRPTAAGGPGDVLCFGLLDESGFGPLVVVPPFASPVELTFVIEGVRAQAADRRRTPGQQRVPVALLTPSNQPIADFLSALAASATPAAEAIWDQTAPQLTPERTHDAGQALDVLVEKFQWPVEALVAAHYLLRFLPNRLPLRWAENLVHAMPLAADGPVIAAWTWIHNRPRSATDDQVDEAVARNVSLALARPVTLFARTRALLFEAKHLVPGDASSDALWRREEVFRRAGAAAGGLESFWGRGPGSPGSEGEARPGPDLYRISLVDEASLAL